MRRRPPNPAGAVGVQTHQATGFRAQFCPRNRRLLQDSLPQGRDGTTNTCLPDGPPCPPSGAVVNHLVDYRAADKSETNQAGFQIGTAKFCAPDDFCL